MSLRYSHVASFTLALLVLSVVVADAGLANSKKMRIKFKIEEIGEAKLVGIRQLTSADHQDAASIGRVLK
jgi:hypothetical protein